MAIRLWGGLECTVNRVRDNYSDQIIRTGHENRVDDLDCFASLGIRTLRYPLLWERTVANDRSDWRWPDKRLSRLRELGIDPIVGLLHHGSGPRFTGLLDPEFPRLFSEYARSVAERYPWVNRYTPINEPLTTARFSCLYGHWYPHAADKNSFARAFLSQCKAIVLAMQQVRLVNPAAQLIQTEDLGKTFGTGELRYQVDFENSRRWITWDLLCGIVNSDHAMWKYFRWAGIPESELAWFQECPCHPDVIGINHYVTSDRFLDEHVDRYPEKVLGGNGRDRYADVEAVRTLHSEDLGPEARIAEAWRRYRLPIAITEAHLGCAEPLQQARWFYEMWEAARSQASERANIIAVTAWSLLGAFDWDSLLTERHNHYERGVFELKKGRVEPTLLAQLLCDLANGTALPAGHPVLNEIGWWHSPERIQYHGNVDEVGLQLTSA